MQSDSFTFLIIGLAKLLDNKQQYPYPYPQHLTAALNHLALNMLARYPNTLSGVLAMFQNPLRSWWPETLKLPDNFNPDAPILYERKLSEEAYEYYYDFYEELELMPNASMISHYD